MTERQIIKKYGSMELSFVEMDKHRAFYRSIKDSNITLSCIVEYRDTINATETISNLLQFECVHLRINDELTIIND